MAITALTNWTYYDGTYKTAMGNVTVPQAVFSRYAIKASNEVRKRTFGNIDESKAIPDSVQFCVCELAEHYYQCDQENDHKGIESEKDGSWSVTYEASDKVASENTKKVSSIINNYLMMTGLLYCGV